MIEYTKTEADIKNRIKDLTWMRGRIFLFMAGGAFVLMLFFFLVGLYNGSNEAIQFAIYAATLVAVCIALFVTLFLKFKKAVNGNFDKNAVEGKIDFTIEQIDDTTFVMTRLTDEESFQVQKSDIKMIRTMKTIHVIILKDGRTIDLPKQPDIDTLILTLK